MVTNVCLSGTWEISKHNYLPPDHDRILKHWALNKTTVSHVNDKEHKIRLNLKNNTVAAR